MIDLLPNITVVKGDLLVKFPDLDTYLTRTEREAEYAYTNEILEAKSLLYEKIKATFSLTHEQALTILDTDSSALFTKVCYLALWLFLTQRGATEEGHNFRELANAVIISKVSLDENDDDTAQDSEKIGGTLPHVRFGR